MKTSLNLNVELDFTDEEIRMFLKSRGYSLEIKSVDVEIYPIGFEKRDVEVAIKKGQKYISLGDGYITVFHKEVWDSKISVPKLGDVCKESLLNS